MKKFLSLLIVAVLAIGCLGSTAFAAETWGSLSVKADTNVEVGEEVDVTVSLGDCTGLTEGVQNAKFTVTIPEGLKVKDGTVAIPAAASATKFNGMSLNTSNASEIIFVTYGTNVNEFYKGGSVALLTFTCVAEKAGTYNVGLTGSLTAGDWTSKTPAIKTATVKVKAEEPSCNHSYEWETDEYNHWKECSKCGDKNAVAPHEWNADGNCICGAVKPADKPNTPDDGDKPDDGNTPDDGDKPDDGDNKGDDDDKVSPPTGDDSTMAGLFVLCVVAVGAAAIARKRVRA